jgi:hypothetical protein
MTRQRRRKRALCPNLTGMDGYNRDGERHNEAADYQGSSSGKLKRSRTSSRQKSDFDHGFLRFLPVLNNPGNLATARRCPAPPTNC